MRVLKFYFLLIWYRYKTSQYNTLNVKLSNSEHNKLKSETKNSTDITLKLSSNVVDDSNEETNFPHN